MNRGIRLRSGPIGLGALMVGALLLAPPAAMAQSGEAADREEAVRLIFERFDGDGDGGISSAEFAQAGKRDFRAVDANGDSNLSQKEFLDPKPRGATKLGKADLVRAQEVWTGQFGLLDADKNGKVSAAEHQRVGKRSFGRMDGDNNGKITLTEMQAAAQ